MARSLTSHPLARLFPDLPDADFAALVEDIRRNGVKVPILVYRGQILDGRQRYRACQKLNIPCPTVSWNGRDPWMEVQSRNLVRRHLAKDQVWAICKLAAERFPDLAGPIRAVKLEAKERQIRKPKSRASRGSTPLLRSRGRNKEAADLIGAQFGVSGTTVKRFDRLAREAPELIPKVAAGELSVKKALQLAARNDLSSMRDRNWQVEQDVQRIQQVIRTAWARCPLENRVTFLVGVRSIFRELMTEYKDGKSSDEDGRLDHEKTPKAS
jgi:hypothetical protein